MILEEKKIKKHINYAQFMLFCTFSTFAQKGMKMMFVERIIRHKLCMIYAFYLFFCSKMIFDQNIFSDC